MSHEPAGTFDMNGSLSMSHFIFQLPVYTVVRCRPPALGSVLMLSNNDQLCVHLFTDRDLCRSYLEAVGLGTTHVGIGLLTRRQLREFLQLAPAQVNKVVLDAIARHGACQRGLIVDIDQLLSAVREPGPCEHIGAGGSGE
jgi:hypothetical protein